MTGLRGAHVVVVGLGVTGDSVVRYARAEDARVTVVEERPGGEDYAARRARATGAGATVVETPDRKESEALGREADLVVPSPGVPERHPLLAAALAAGVPVRSEVDLAAAQARVPLVAVTGTNGKTTVTTLVAAMLGASGARAISSGNIGHPLLDAVADADEAPATVVVAELSSFQLRFTTEAFRPRVAVLLNLGQDHLDWHGSVAAYHAAKARVFAHQHADDVLVYNADDALVAALAARASARRVAWTVAPDGLSDAYRVRDGALVTPEGACLVEVRELRARSPHDLANALAAAAAALEVGSTVAGVHAALRGAARLPHRVELVGKAGGVAFYDDSKATNPDATLRAVEGFERSVLIAGGRNKGLDLGALRAAGPRLRAVVAIGEAAGEVERAFAGVVPVERAGSMRAAVAAAARQAASGDAVLLSPACASFDWYAGYAARGDDFAAAVRELVEDASA